MFGIRRPFLGLGRVALGAALWPCSRHVAFTCVWLQSVLSCLRGNWDPVSCLGVMGGYNGGGHRVLTDGKRQVKVCRDAVFLEEPADRADSSEPAPKRTSAEPGVNVKTKTDVGADVLLVDSSCREDRNASDFIPLPPQSVVEENVVPAEDKPEELAALPEERAATDLGRARCPLRSRKQTTRCTFDVDGAAVMVCSDTPVTRVCRKPMPLAIPCDHMPTYDTI
jgi:hypothetical protein